MHFRWKLGIFHEIIRFSAFTLFLTKYKSCRCKIMFHRICFLLHLPQNVFEPICRYFFEKKINPREMKEKDLAVLPQVCLALLCCWSSCCFWSWMDDIIYQWFSKEESISRKTIHLESRQGHDFWLRFQCWFLVTIFLANFADFFFPKIHWKISFRIELLLMKHW